MSRKILTRLGIDAKKSLGQNFMIRQHALQQMADAAALAADDAVLEIGAGLGALTEVLAARARRLVAVEIDQRFISYLQETFSGHDHVEVVHGDILEMDVQALMGADAGCYKAIANLPYYITTAIIRHLLEGSASPEILVITLQYEVAERIIAEPSDMSILAVSVQVYGRPEIVTRLSAGNFYPPPKIESAVLRITPHAAPLIVPDERRLFFRVVRAGFSQPRKQIKNPLAAGLHLDKDVVVNWLGACGIDPRRRAETLAVEEWLALARYYQQMQ